MLRQWIKYQRQSLKYSSELADNIYYRNVNNNAGIFDYLIGAAEEQECKEAFLAFYFLLIAPSPPTIGELEDRVEAWLRRSFGIELAFKIAEAVAKLESVGIVSRQGERLFVSPLDGAIDRLQDVWNSLLPAAKGAPD